MAVPGDAAAIGRCRAFPSLSWARYRDGGWAALRELPSTPQHQPRQLSAVQEDEIVAARAERGRTAHLGAMLGRPASTVGTVRRRLGRRLRYSPSPERDIHS